jgi:thiamine-monophosphate kinase
VEPARGTASHIAIGPGREFDLVRKMLSVWGDTASGIGDDAAILDPAPGERLVVSTDTAVLDVHFRRDWLSAEEIGFRSTMAALSDLAAMAARPVGVLVALTLPRDWSGQLEPLARGVGEAARLCSAPIVGGDLTSGRELSLTITVLGGAVRPLSRAAARAGDHVYVTGILGGPAAAVRAWNGGAQPSAWCRARFARPIARIREALWLAERGAHAMIDISDGLGSELRHLARASRVRLRVDLDRVPRGPGVEGTDAIRGGDELELLFTAGEGLDADTFARTFGAPVTDIGDASPAPDGEVVAERSGVRVDLELGHDHYSL